VKDEQETLIALADVAIGVFAIESGAAGRRRSPPPGTPPVRSSPRRPSRRFAFPAAEAAVSARGARLLRRRGNSCRCSSPASAGDPVDASGLLEAKHKLAAAALESERYPF